MGTHQCLNEMKKIDAFKLRLRLERGIRITIALDAESCLYPLIILQAHLAIVFI